jgi:hypothetical protein
MTDDLRTTSLERLYARLEDLSARGRNEFIKAVLECDDYELTISLLDTMRLSSAHTVALLAQLVGLRERGASEADFVAWHKRVCEHLKLVVAH